jgi:biopolymer transport protein ExbB
MNIRTSRKISAIIAATLLTVMAWYAYAQDAPPAATDGNGAAASELVAVEETGVNTTLWGLIRQGGWIMFPLILLSVGAVGLTIYGFITVRDEKMLHPELVTPLQNELSSMHLDKAKEICSQTPCLLTNTLLAGLDRISDGILDVPSMEKAMEEASIQETTEGMKPINYLSIIAQIAPMLGLLGTVSGMIKAFQKIGLGGMGRPEQLADNIGEAMVTTAAGLIIGIPAMFFYFYLKNKYMSNVSQLARILGNLSHHLVASSRRSGSKSE